MYAVLAHPASAGKVTNGSCATLAYQVRQCRRNTGKTVPLIPFVGEEDTDIEGPGEQGSEFGRATAFCNPVIDTEDDDDFKYTCAVKGYQH